MRFGQGASLQNWTLHVSGNSPSSGLRDGGIVGLFDFQVIQAI